MVAAARGFASMKSSKPDWLRDKKLNFLVQLGLEKHPEAADVPNALDLVTNDRGQAVDAGSHRPPKHQSALSGSTRRSGQSPQAEIRSGLHGGHEATSELKAESRGW